MADGFLLQAHGQDYQRLTMDYALRNCDTQFVMSDSNTDISNVSWKPERDT